MAAITRAPEAPAGRGAIRTPRVSALLFGGLALSALAAVGLLQVLQTTHTAGFGYELRAFERERATLSAEVRLLEAEIAQMSRLDYMRDQATERLGMVAAERTLRIAVGVPAPRVVPLPERYVGAAPALAAVERTWWERLLGGLPGFE